MDPLTYVIFGGLAALLVRRPGHTSVDNVTIAIAGVVVACAVVMGLIN